MCRSLSKIAIAFFVALSVSVAHADARPDGLEGKALAGEALDREATNLYQQVFSPFCPGRSLNDCPSSKAAELKDQMRAELEAGKAPEVILNEVFQKFGDQYRAVPQFAGVGMFVWLVPIAFVVVGLAIAVGVSISRKKSSSASVAPTTPSLSPDDERRVREELSKLD
jgi:cytochrome c-type biogenesis protein CcmH